MAAEPFRTSSDRIVLIAEDVFAPALCVISIVQRGGVNAVSDQAAVSMPLSLLNIIARQPEVPDPTGHAILSGRRSIVTDFSTAPHWPEHAQRALMHGLRSCWAEPIPDCGDDLAGIATLYFRDERRPDVYDERLLCILTTFIGLALNIAQQHVAFRAANDRFTALVSAIPGVVYQRVVKPDGDIRYTYISEGARDLFGVSPQEILADPEVLFSTHSPEYRAKFRERLLAASKALTTWDVEATLVTAAGRKKHTHAIARPDRQEDGSVLWTGVILDETRTREAIVDSIALGLLLYDAQDRLIMRNSHYLTFFPTLSGIAVPGATYQEVVQAECKRIALISGESAEHTKVLRGRLERRTELRNVFEWQIGTHHWLLVNEQRTGDGGSVILYTDITELKRREKQI